MSIKLINFIFVYFIVSLIIFSSDRPHPVKIVPPVDAFGEDTGPITKQTFVSINDGLKTDPIVYTSDNIIITIIEIPEGRTQYGLQSNVCPNLIVQNPLTPSNIHSCFMVATDPNPWSTRNIRYFFTTNGGTNWDWLGTVTSTRSGFPSITMTQDGRAIIAGHCNDGGGILRSQIYIDIAPGAGSWTRLDPGGTGGSITPIWPDAFCDRLSNKVLFCGSQQVPGDSLFRNVCNFNPTMTFLGYQFIANAKNAGSYSCAVTLDGQRYGIAYLTTNGGAQYITSTNDGVTWSSPATIWTWNPMDSIGTLRSVDLVYDASGIPKAIIGLGHVVPVEVSYIPWLYSRLVFWSPNINGGIPVTIDSAAGLNGSNPSNDVIFSVDRGVIGMSYDNSAIYVAYNKARPDASIQGNNFFDVWFRYSTTGGATWSTKTRLTNNSGQLMDCRYPSISPTNHFAAPNHFVHIITQADSIAGSNVTGAPDSWAKMWYIRLAIDEIPVGIQQISSEIPAHYSLSQNYPNPFNPTTQIEFSLPKESFVKIIIYNSLGQQMDAVMNEKLSAGSYKTDWDGENFPSGVYFYTLKTENYFESKKMVLIK
ncbi:MAG TPA: T9SS type A sorting domain-containing protein [Ignavibacteria bacterium]